MNAAPASTQDAPRTVPVPRPSRRDQIRLVRHLLSTPQSALDEVNARYGPICGLGAGPLRMMIVGRPALIRELLLLPNDRFIYDIPISPFRFVVGKTTMIGSDGDDHKRRRGSVQQAFSRRRLERWIPLIIDRTDDAIDQLLATSTPDVPVDLYPIGRRLLIDIVLRTLFGERLATRIDEIDQRFARSQLYLSRPLFRQIPHPIPWTERAAVRRDRAGLDAVIDGAIVASRAHPPTGDDAGDVLDSLVHRTDLSDEEIRDQVKSLIGAGYDTSASSLAWILWEATNSAGLWAALRSEADSVLGVVGAAPLDNSALTALDVAHRTMRESLRVHPASGVSARTTACEIRLGDHAIPKGTLMLWSPYLAGRDPSVWEQPERFDPERFAILNASQRTVADEAWVPFGRGPRMCVGFALAQMELTLILARLAQRLDIRPNSTVIPEPVGLIVSQPRGGAQMFVSARPSG
ncbi:MAG: cytochrome P450 [Ilumatobacter sp.]|jgi:cytochrome P450